MRHRVLLALVVALGAPGLGCHEKKPVRHPVLPPETMADFLRARTAWLLREPRQSLAFSLRVLAGDPASTRARVDAASALAALGDLDRARALLRRAPTQDFGLIFQRARLAALGGDPTLARSLTRRLERMATNAGRWTEISRLWRLLSEPGREVRALKRALALRSDHLEAMMRLVWWLRRKGRFRDADRLLLRMGRVHPEAYQVLFDRVSVRLDLGRPQQAWLLLREALRESPADLQLVDWSLRLALFRSQRDQAFGLLEALSAYRGSAFQAFVAEKLAGLGDFARAATLSARALSDHWSLSAFRVRLVALLALGSEKRALEELGQVLDHPKQEEALSGLAEPLTGFGVCKEALALYRAKTAWAEKRPSCRAGAWVLLERAQLEAVCGNRARALALENRVGRRCGLASGIAFARSALLAAAGHPREAADLALSMAERDPDDPQAGNQAGYLLADAGMQLDRAERLLRDAVLADPLSGAFRDSLGWLEFRKGRFDAAEKLLSEARRLLPTEAEVAWHLGALAQARAEHCKVAQCRRRYVCQAVSWYARASKEGLAPRFRKRMARRLARIESAAEPVTGSCGTEEKP